MGSDLYKVKVVEKNDRTVKLRVEVVHPDSNYVSDNESFALMLLHEGTRDTSNAVLAQEVSFEDTMDRGWLELYTRGFIERSQFQKESGSSEGQSEADWIKGTLTVTVTDPAWIAHLKPGAEFDSRAWDVTSDFNDCKPIHPGQIDPNAPVPEAFIAVPGSLWDDAKLPKVVRVAAYSPSAYRMVSPRKGTLSAADLKDLDGQVVLHQGQYDDSPRISLLHLDGESVRLFSASDGSHGSSSSSPFEGSIGKAELVPGKRLGTRLRLSRFLGNVKPKVTATKVEGEAFVSTISVPPGNTTFESLSEDQLPALGFLLLINPLLPRDSFGDRVLAPSPFSWTVEREVVRLFPAEERQMSTYVDGQMVPAGDSLPDASSLAPRLARGFVAKTELLSKPAVASGDLDTLTEAQQRAALEKPWAELVVKVTPHHVVYLQHLSAAGEPTSLEYVPEAQPWEGPPATPATAETGFGKKKVPPASTASSSSSQQSSPAPTTSGGPPKMLKMVGIGCGVLIGLFLCCLILGSLVGGK